MQRRRRWRSLLINCRFLKPHKRGKLCAFSVGVGLNRGWSLSPFCSNRPNLELHGGMVTLGLPFEILQASTTCYFPYRLRWITWKIRTGQDESQHLSAETMEQNRVFSSLWWEWVAARSEGASQGQGTKLGTPVDRLGVLWCLPVRKKDLDLRFVVHISSFSAI